jgi:glyoxylase-like metal-dependent hydrolase (beta-lactamase superfamily II)
LNRAVFITKHPVHPILPLIENSVPYRQLPYGTGELILKKMILLFVVAFFFARTAASPADSVGFTETRLNDRVLLLHHGPWAETMTVIDAGPSLIVVDMWGSLHAAEKAKVRIEAIFKKPASHVINTHHHWDHTFGNAAFSGAEIIGHRFCTEDMKADYADAEKRKAYFEKSASRAEQESLRKYIHSAGVESSGETFRLLPPDRSVGERDTLHAGNLTILFYHTPGIHTRSNITVFIPELGIVFGRREFADASQLKLEPGADSKIIARVLDDILVLNKPIHYLISGHGQPVEDPDLKAGVERLKGMDSQ